MEKVKDFVGNNDQILEKWKAKFLHIHGVENERKFAPDGIINKGDYHRDENGNWWRERSDEKGTIENDLWAKAPLRILFLTKDENLYDDDIPAWDVRKETFHARHSEWNANMMSSSFFYSNEACQIVGLLKTNLESKCEFDSFSWQEAVQVCDESIFARINCKKAGGGSTIKDSKLKEVVDDDYELLKEQIFNLEPDVLICCGHQGERNVILNKLYEIYDNEFEYIDYGTGIGSGTHYNALKNIVAFDMYHLAYQEKKKGLSAEEALSKRYYDIIDAYYDFIKYLQREKGIDFTTHR